MSGAHDGKVAIVTGGASGIGAATAPAAGPRRRARLRRPTSTSPRPEGVAKEISEAGGEAFALRVDVSSESDNADMVAETTSRYGALLLLHLNAGIASMSSVEDGDLEVWNRVVAINLTGVYLGMRASVPALRAAGGGAMVATASVAGLIGGRGMPSYYATKHGVVGLVKSAAAELAPDIRVNAVCPGVIDTPILGPGHGVSAVTDILARGHLAGRVGRPEEVAALVSFLLSEQSAFTTGVAWPVDGGLIASLGSGDDPSDEERATLEKIPRARELALVRLPQLRQHRVVLEGAGVAHLLLAGGDAAQEAPHDLAGARLGQGVGEADVLRLGDRADLLGHVAAQRGRGVVVHARPALRRDERHDRRAGEVVGPADHGRLGHLRWETSALSTSMVPMRWPETFITSSMRPMIQK